MDGFVCDCFAAGQLDNCLTTTKEVTSCAGEEFGCGRWIAASLNKLQVAKPEEPFNDGVDAENKIQFAKHMKLWEQWVKECKSIKEHGKRAEPDLLKNLPDPLIDRAFGLFKG